MMGEHRMLLRKTARLYQKHEAGRPETFNVFSILIGICRESVTFFPDVKSPARKESVEGISILPGDPAEMKLHSRFLEGLLGRRNRPRGNRENLADFLGFLSDIISDLDPENAVIDRGFEDFDIVIHDASSRQVILIENGIRGGTQTRRLREYAKHLKIQGYEPHLVYLTLDADIPSKGCRRNVNYECILCREDFSSWLKRCQQRAYNEPPLRESIGQYLHWIAQMTGTDYTEGYMNDLMRLCLKGENLLLVKDLKDAMVEAEVRLLFKLWQEIALRLKERVPDLPELSEDVSDITEGTIRRFVTDRKYRWHGLFYGIARHVFLGVVAEESICFGVVCSEKISENEYIELKKSLERGRSGGAGYLWQCPRGFEYLNLRNPRREDLQMLSSKKKRKKYVEEIVSGLHAVWGRVKEAGLA